MIFGSEFVRESNLEPYNFKVRSLPQSHSSSAEAIRLVGFIVSPKVPFFLKPRRRRPARTNRESQQKAQTEKAAPMALFLFVKKYSISPLQHSAPPSLQQSPSHRDYMHNNNNKKKAALHIMILTMVRIK